LATTSDGGAVSSLNDMWAQAEIMEGPEALPRTEGEPMFSEPWHGRLVAMAVETVHRRNLPWDTFRQQLIGAIAADNDRPYYDSFLIALEQFVLAEDLTDAADLVGHRLVAASYRTSETSPDDLEVFPIAVDEASLLEVLTLIFTEWWSHIAFGPLIEGAVYEMRATSQPRLSMFDGYLTVDLGGSHFHLCIGEHRGSNEHPVSEQLARRRRWAHAELHRLWVDGAPRTWMLRMFNGDGHQQLTVLFPNPFLDDDQRALDQPDWTKLMYWDELRERCLNLPSDPADRLGTHFVHA
jgi:hypothetical protein